VLEPVSELQRRGHSVTIVPPSRSGIVEADAVIAALRPETRVVAMMLANNETGVIQPVGDVARICRERSIHLHCDAVQGAGKIDVDVGALGVDTLALSAHKLHAPKGIGALYVRRGLALDRHILGGAQERRRRAGTENVPLAAAFGVASALARAPGGPDIGALRDALEGALGASGFSIVINGAGVPRIPNTSSITFPGADAEGIVIGLDLSGVAVSTGAACSSGRVEPSHVLLAMGLTADEARSTIRVSLSRFTTRDEIEHTVALLRVIAPRCMGISRASQISLDR
jgi:cysteine desulfurase